MLKSYHLRSYSLLITSTLGNIVKTVKTKIGALVGTITNMRGNAFQISDVKLSTPYGVGSIPPKGATAVIIPVEGSTKSSVVVGYLINLPTGIAHDFVDGESWLHSRNYLLGALEDALQAYRHGDTNYKATLPNGEFVGNMMLNRINEIEIMLQGINTNYTALQQAYNTHAHSGVMTGAGVSGVPSATISIPPLIISQELAKDKASIIAEEYLINDKGKMYA